ncbi:MAG: polyphosphate polymerase domain-containing protein [Firmicutes bacterium]|nr:polyphosphate polymerase domain-containing protein [Bacillota bacterium]
MEKIINVFARHEIKYILTAEQRRTVMRGIKDRMIPDPHGMSTIRNIYYDTPDYRLIRRSLEKPSYKEKIRLRSYGSPTEDTVVFLELKKKFDKVVYKRRVELKERDAEKYMAGELGLEELKERIAEVSNPQIAKEIDYFKNYYKNLKPMVYLSYDRCAYFSEEDESLRITFDKNIRWRGNDVRLTSEEGGEDLLAEGESLMEIKTATALPIWLVEVLNQAKARPASFSKYGKAYGTIAEKTISSGREVEKEPASSEKIIYMPQLRKVMKKIGVAAAF